MTKQFHDAYVHAAKVASVQVSQQRDLVNYLDAMWILKPHASHEAVRGMCCGIIAGCYGISLKP